MVVLDESEQNFIVNVPEVVDLKQRNEDRKRTGRNLAVIVVLLIVGLGIYHTVSHIALRTSALISAGTIMTLYLLSLWYAARRRKLKQKKDDQQIEKQVTTVLEKLNNLKQLESSVVSESAHDNYVFTREEEEETRREEWKLEMTPCVQAKPLKKQISIDYSCTNYGRSKTINEELNQYDGSEVFIRTYSVG